MIDGGSVNVPEFGNASVDGEWVIEGWGVEPDIEVANDPEAVLEGRDPQLERAVEVALGLLESQGITILPQPPDPVRVKRPN